MTGMLERMQQMQRALRSLESQEQLMQMMMGQTFARMAAQTAGPNGS
jgi:hypothetical protein